MRYEDLGEDYYDRQASIRRKTRYHLTELEDLGWDVDLRPRAEPSQDHQDATPAA
jgi:hypothetical protein